MNRLVSSVGIGANDGGYVIMGRLIERIRERDPDKSSSTSHTRSDGVLHLRHVPRCPRRGRTRYGIYYGEFRGEDE